MSGGLQGFWKLRDGRVALVEGAPYPTEHGEAVKVAVLLRPAENMPGWHVERTAVSLADLAERAAPPTGLGTVLDREVRIDAEGRRHITFTCELPGLSGRLASL